MNKYKNREEKAYAAFSKIMPGLQSVARSLSGTSVKLVPSSVSRTDGKNIEVAVPAELADQPEHERALCGKTDSSGNQLCESCSVRDEIISSLRHEISHIVYGSFDSATGHHVSNLNRAAEKFLGGDYGYATSVESYSGLINRYDPVLPAILNSLEDIRINNKAGAASPGLHRMHKLRYEKILREGVERSDGSVARFMDASPDGQLIAAIMYIAQGYEYEGHFDEQIIKDAKLKGISKVVSQLNGGNSYTAAKCSIELLSEARKLGYFKPPEPEEGDPEKENKSESGSEAQVRDEEGSGGDGSTDGGNIEAKVEGTQGEAPGERNDQDGLPDETDSQESDDGKSTDPGLGDDSGANEDQTDVEEGSGEYGDSHDSHDDTSDDPADGGDDEGSSSQESVQEVAELVNALVGHDDKHHHESDSEELNSRTLDGVIKSLQYLSRVPIGIAGVDFVSEGEVKDDYFMYHDPEYTESDIGRAVQKARIAFTLNATEGHHRNQRSGKIVGAALGRRAPFGDERMFGRRVTPDKRKYEVLIGLDISGSTWGINIARIKDTGAALAEVCNRTGIDFSIYCHTSRDICAIGKDVDYLKLVEIKKASTRWTPDVKKRLASVSPGGVNLDGHTLQFYRRTMDKSDATDKVIMYFTDGKMPSSNYKEELEVLQSEINMCKKKGYTLLGVGIGTDSPKRHGLDTVLVNSANDMRTVVDRLAAVLPRR